MTSTENLTLPFFRSSWFFQIDKRKKKNKPSSSLLLSAPLQPRATMRPTPPRRGTGSARAGSTATRKGGAVATAAVAAALSPWRAPVAPRPLALGAVSLFFFLFQRIAAPRPGSPQRRPGWREAGSHPHGRCRRGGDPREQRAEVSEEEGTNEMDVFLAFNSLASLVFLRPSWPSFALLRRSLFASSNC